MAHGEQRLSHCVVDFVRASVIQIFALEPHGGANAFGKSAERTWSADGRPTYSLQQTVEICAETLHPAWPAS